MTAASIIGGADFRVGDVLSRAWRLCISNILFFVAVPFVIFIISFVGAMVFGLLFVFAGMGISSVGGMGPGSIALAVVGVALIIIVVLALNVIGQGVLLLGAFQRLRGQTIRIGEAVQRVLNRFLPLVGVGLLYPLAVFITFAVSTAILSGIVSVVGGWAFVLFPLFCVPAAILGVMWVVGTPVCLVEGFGPIVSLGRSAELTKGYRWKIFGIFVLLMLVFVGGYVVQLVLGLASQLLAGLFGIVWSVVWTAYLYCTIIMTYHDLRVAKEGVDTEQIASVFD